jgi:hypothetical protein
VPLFAPQLRQWNEDKRIRTFAHKKTVEIGAMLARHGSKIEAINPQVHFYRLVFILFFPGHAITRNALSTWRKLDCSALI